MIFNLSYIPDPIIDFPIMEKMMTAIEKESYSCVKLQSIYDRVDKYTDKNYWERIIYTAAMAQAMTEYYRPEWCTIQE